MTWLHCSIKVYVSSGHTPQRSISMYAEHYYVDTTFQYPTATPR